jgi:hypothetical protein
MIIKLYHLIIKIINYLKQKIIRNDYDFYDYDNENENGNTDIKDEIEDIVIEYEDIYNIENPFMA